MSQSSPKPLPRAKLAEYVPVTEGSKPSPPAISPKPGTSKPERLILDPEKVYSAAQASIKASSPTLPAPTFPKPEYSTPQPTPAPRLGAFSIPRSSSYGQSPLSAVLKQAIVDSPIRRSSSVDEKLHTIANHPLEKSAVSWYASPKHSLGPSSPMPSSSKASSNAPRMAGQNASGSESALLSTDRESSQLSSFIEKRQQDLPLRVQVTTGYQGVLEHDSISIGDVFNLHFLKKTTVIEIENLPQKKYYIPLNSAVQVRIPYEGTLNAYNFTVADLMSSSKPPLLMKAVNSYQCSSPKHSVEEDEVFVVECTKTKTLSRHIKVFSITHQVAKKLKTDCSTSFTTNATLYVSDILKHLSASLPLRAVLYFDQNAHLSNELSEKEVTLLNHGIRSTVVASHHEEDGRPETSNILEIPIDTDISVSALCLDELGKKALCALTQNILKHLDPSRVDVVSANGETVRLIRKGHELLGYTLVVPSSLESSDAAPQTDDDEDDVYENMDIDMEKMEVKGNINVGGGETPTDDISGMSVQLRAMRRMVETMQSQTNTAEGLGRSTKIQVASLRNEMLEMKSGLVAVEKAVEALTVRLESAIAGFVQPKLSSCTERFVNATSRQLDSEQQSQLEVLDNAQVLDLLKKMGLEQYQDKFRSEMITGEVLAECDEDVLQHELGISTKIHRIRLMKIIKEKTVPNIYANTA